MRGKFLEKRKHPRLDLRIPMRYRKIQTNIEELKGSLIKNISEGGMMINAYEFLPLNSRLTMEIPLVSGTKSVEGTCRVAWIKKAGFSEQYDVGVEFANLNQGDTAQIAKFIFNKNVEQIL